MGKWSWSMATLLLVAVCCLTASVALADEEEGAGGREMVEEGARVVRLLSRRSMLNNSPEASNYKHLSPTCTKKPSICKKQGSKRPNCCKGVCVNVHTDKNNCGKCGKKAGKDHSCCSGKVVNLKSDPRNCGHCGKRCAASERCVYGLCNYGG